MFADAETAREQALAALREAASTERWAQQEAVKARRRAESAEAAREQAVRELTAQVDQAQACMLSVRPALGGRLA